jgi:hypothetical protein
MSDKKITISVKIAAGAKAHKQTYIAPGTVRKAMTAVSKSWHSTEL